MAHLAGDPQEQALPFKELLTGVTCFFRDAPVWQHLQSTGLPQALADADGRVLRAWLRGCSTGEEACSLAIAFAACCGSPACRAAGGRSSPPSSTPTPSTAYARPGTTLDARP